jgi:S1-C subfamily serine protease
MKKSSKKNNVILELIKCVVIGLFLGGVVILGITQYQTFGKITALTVQLKSSKGIEKDLTDNYKDLTKKIEQVPKIIEINKLSLEAKLKQVNVAILNKTINEGGSGVTIKYKGTFYILSAGHMIDNTDDELMLSENGQEICELEIVKHSYDAGNITYYSNDLVLLRPKNRNIVPTVYIEIADVEPEVSNELYIVGNPLSMEDVISDARVTMYKGNFMYVKGDSYFGNSGGGIYTRDGKLVGIMSHIFPIRPFPDRIYEPEDPTEPLQLIPGIPAYVINGAVRLNVILEFLRGVK